jgi:hypothetical protein
MAESKNGNETKRRRTIPTLSDAPDNLYMLQGRIDRLEQVKEIQWQILCWIVSLLFLDTAFVSYLWLQ